MNVKKLYEEVNVKKMILVNWVCEKLILMKTAVKCKHLAGMEETGNPAA